LDLGGAELHQGTIDGFAIFWGGLDQHIEILGGARLGVVAHRVGTHDQVFHFMLVEDGQEFFEVVVQAGLSSRGAPWRVLK